MSERILKFRIYSYVDKLWHYFDIYEGYPQGIYGAVTPPQQFTGLTDKNGKEIYEGDIAKQTHSYIDIEKRDWIGEVKFSITQQGPGYYPSFSLFINQYISFNLRVDSEVIGNVIENKELLQK